ncbi:hypothetical protein N9Z25_07090 [Luminiphilus sp.]|nr:hypothetical protein [Luminiphilus sp.]
MYSALLYIHVLALVYWLGGDLGTYLSSRHVLRSDLGVESRQTAFKILMECDMGPRLAMPIILGSGCHLAALRWPTLLPGETALIGWLVVAIWVGLVAAIHSSIGHRMPSLAQWDLRLRFAVVFTLLAAGTYGLSLGLPGWVLLKILIFAVLVACGIAVRFGLKPFALAYVQMINEGASEAGNAAMVSHMGVVRRYVWIIWLGLFINAALGLRVITF